MKKLITLLLVVAAGSMPRPASANPCTFAQCTQSLSNFTLVQGSRVLAHPEVTLLFWGSEWITATGPSLSEIIGASQDLINGAYLGGLAQYANSSAPRMVPAVDFVPNSTLPVPQQVTDANVEAMLEGQFGHYVSAPDANVDMIYLVFIPNGHTLSHGDGGTAYHYAAQRSGGGQEYYFAAIGAPSTQVNANLAGVMLATGHELVEAITDPDFGGVYLKHTTGCSCEIGDICDNLTAQSAPNGQNFTKDPVTGFKLSHYYSKNDGGKCVAPIAWSGLHQYLRASASWPTVTGATSVRQMVQGNFGLAFEDGAGNVWLQRGTGAPVKIATAGATGSPAPVSTLAVDANTVYAVPLNGASTLKYNGTGTSWSVIGGPAAAIYAGAFSTGSGIGLFAESFPPINGGAGALYQYTGSASSWVLASVGANAYYVSNSALYQVSIDRSLNYISNSSGGWQLLGNLAGDLYGGPFGVAATGLGNRNVFYFPATGTATQQGGNNSMYAVTLTDGAQPSQLYGLTPSRATIIRSTSLTTTTPPWDTASATAASHIVGGGSYLYATWGLTLDQFTR